MSVDVTNVGKVPGKEVVQLYVADHESTVIRPVRELKGFEKIALEPGETKTVTFTLGKRAFAYWNTEIHDWHGRKGQNPFSTSAFSACTIALASLTAFWKSA